MQRRSTSGTTRRRKLKPNQEIHPHEHCRSRSEKRHRPGRCTLRRGCAASALRGDRIFQGDEIVTGAASMVTIELPDGRLIDLGRDTRWASNEFAPRPPMTAPPRPRPAPKSCNRPSPPASTRPRPSKPPLPVPPALAAPPAAVKPAVAAVSSCWTPPAASLKRRSVSPPRAWPTAPPAPPRPRAPCPTSPRSSPAPMAAPSPPSA